MNGLRRINLEQAINVRDLGGYPTPDGCTPYGRFIRADNMYGLTEADLETLYQAGVRTVIDLRTPGERERQPGSFENWRDVRVVPCSLLGESLDSFTGFMRSLGENYSEMIVRDRDHYRDLFEIILSENQRGGILFHCTAGKDRTGVTAALLLGLAGNVAVAAYGVVANFALVATAIFNGVAQGAQPLVSRCYGHSDRAGARKLLILGSCTALALAAVLYAVVFGMTDTLVGWFNSENSAQMARFAHNGMRLYFVGYFFAGFNIVAAGYLSATNRPVEASVTSICRGVAAIVVCSLVMSALFGMNGVWAAFPAAELLTALLTLFLLLRKKKQTV